MAFRNSMERRPLIELNNGFAKHAKESFIRKGGESRQVTQREFSFQFPSFTVPRVERPLPSPLAKPGGLQSTLQSPGGLKLIHNNARQAGSVERPVALPSRLANDIESLLQASTLHRQQMLEDNPLQRARGTGRVVTKRPFTMIELMEILPPWTPLLIAPGLQEHATPGSCTQPLESCLSQIHVPGDAAKEHTMHAFTPVEGVLEREGFLKMTMKRTAAGRKSAVTPFTPVEGILERAQLPLASTRRVLAIDRHAAAEDSTPLDCATTGLEPSAADAATSDGTGEVRGEEQPEAFSTAPPDEEDCMRTTGALHEDSTEDDDDGGYGPGWDEELQEDDGLGEPRDANTAPFTPWHLEGYEGPSPPLLKDANAQTGMSLEGSMRRSLPPFAARSSPCPGASGRAPQKTPHRLAQSSRASMSLPLEALEQACNTPPTAPEENNRQDEDGAEADKVASLTPLETPFTNANELDPPATSSFSACLGGGLSPEAGASQINDDHDADAEASPLPVPPAPTPRPPRQKRPGKLPNERLRRAVNSRKSLAGEGLQPDHGRRRSVRERHRPLEYWRNEKKVYTRQYRSLPTVDHIETRTASPSWQFVEDVRSYKRMKNREDS